MAARPVRGSGDVFEADYFAANGTGSPATSPRAIKTRARRVSSVTISVPRFSDEHGPLSAGPRYMLSAPREAVERPATPTAISQHSWMAKPVDDSSSEDEYTAEIEVEETIRSPGSAPTFVATARGGPLPVPTLRTRWRLFWVQLRANAFSAVFLLFIVVWALSARFLGALPYYVPLHPTFWRSRRRREAYEWDDSARWRGEKLVKDVKYYARSCGYEIIDQTVRTADGYLLRVHKVLSPRAGRSKGGYPVVIQHGPSTCAPRS